MSMKLRKSRYQTQPKHKTQNKETEKHNKISSSSPNLQTFKSGLQSGNGFVVWDNSLKFWVVLTSKNECRC